MKRELRQKNGPTPKQNKYKNPAHAERVFFHLAKGMGQAQARAIVRKRSGGPIE